MYVARGRTVVVRGVWTCSISSWHTLRLRISPLRESAPINRPGIPSPSAIHAFVFVSPIRTSCVFAAFAICVFSSCVAEFVSWSPLRCCPAGLRWAASRRMALFPGFSRWFLSRLSWMVFQCHCVGHCRALRSSTDSDRAVESMAVWCCRW